MNGPTPIMSIMFRAVALPRPIPRINVGELPAGSWDFGMIEKKLPEHRARHQEKRRSELRLEYFLGYGLIHF